MSPRAAAALAAARLRLEARTLMVRQILLVIPFVLSASAAVFAGDAPYGWTISASSTEPFENTDAATFTNRTVYLWISCSSPGFTTYAAEFDIVSTGITHLQTTVLFPWLNAGGTSDLLLANDCSSGLQLVATFDIIDLPGSMCITPSAANGRMGTLDCPTLLFWPIEWIGYDNTGGVPCSNGTATCDGTTSVARGSWGRIKSVYR